MSDEFTIPQSGRFSMAIAMPWVRGRWRLVSVVCKIVDGMYYAIDAGCLSFSVDDIETLSLDLLMPINLVKSGGLLQGDVARCGFRKGVTSVHEIVARGVLFEDEAEVEEFGANRPKLTAIDPDKPARKF